MSGVDMVQLCRDALREADCSLDDSELSRETELLSVVDSVTLMDVIGRVEGRLGIALPDEVLTRLCTVADLEQAVASLQSESTLSGDCHCRREAVGPTPIA